ncbi:MAG: hypothetical protein FWF96_08275, partial [Kiritimatiellaeota bacterium]|nr:hypothetical protein [Kiritimatiellota bacterium]
TVTTSMPVKQASQYLEAGARREFRLVSLQRRDGEELLLRIIDPDGAQAWNTLNLGIVWRALEAPRMAITPDGTLVVLHRATREFHIKTVLVSDLRGVRILSHENILTPEAEAKVRLQNLQRLEEERKKQEKKSPWWKFW